MPADETASLVLAQAIYKAVAGMVSTKDPDGLRGRFDARVMAQYAETGAKTIDLRGPDGSKVGTASVRVGRDEPAHVEQEVLVTDRGRLVRELFADEDALREYVEDNALSVARWMVAAGYIFDGMEIASRDVPARPGQPTGVSLRVDPRKVAASYGKALPAAVAGFLAEGVGDDD